MRVIRFLLPVSMASVLALGLHSAPCAAVVSRSDHSDGVYTVKRIVIYPEGSAPRGRPPEVDLGLEYPDWIDAAFKSR